VVDNGYVKFSQ